MHTYEEAIQKMERGELVDDEIQEILNELRTGRYNTQQWRYNWLTT